MEGRSALVILHDAEGQPLHAGLGGKMEVGNAGFTVGYDGQAYLQDLQPSNTVVIELPEGECRASFAYTPDPGQQVVVGPVQCL
jgi:outer membrane usher protein